MEFNVHMDINLITRISERKAVALKRGLLLIKKLLKKKIHQFTTLASGIDSIQLLNWNYDFFTITDSLRNTDYPSTKYIETKISQIVACRIQYDSYK